VDPSSATPPEARTLPPRAKSDAGFVAGASVRVRAFLAAPVPPWFVVACLVGVVVMTLVLTSRSEHLRWPEAAAVYKSWLIAGPVLVGLVWWRRRPASRFGPLLVVFGFLAAPTSLADTSSPLLHSLGSLADAPFIAFNFYLCLAYPLGRLSTTLERALVWTWTAVLAASFAVFILFLPQLSSGGPLTRCVGGCPENPFQVASAPDFVDLVGRIEIYTGLVIATAICFVYVARLRSPSRPRRRALLAVAVSSLLLLPAFVAFHFARVVLEVDPATADALGWVLIATRVLFPLGFLLVLLQADVFAAAALRRMLGDLSSRPSHARWQTAVAEALDDPRLRVAYRDPDGRFVEPDGTEVAPESPPDGGLRVPVAQGEAPVAFLTVDPALADDPELVQAAASATLIAIESGRLEGDLRASLRRLVDAGDTERHRIERDLHDSAQQRLLSLRMRLDRAGETLAHGPPDQQLLAELGEQIDAAIDELRDVARGVYPPALAAHGLAAAIEGVIRRSELRARVSDEGLPRMPEHVERTVYFCCLEALQNVAKHAGPDARATVRLRLDGTKVEFVVEDDGRGFDPAVVQRGTGLTNLADRVAAHGGALSVDPVPGGGTRLAGWVDARAAGGSALGP
jgi:signal transduction histidine kinase